MPSEPHYVPDLTALDSPADYLREIASRHNISGTQAEFDALINEAMESGVFERIAETRSTHELAHRILAIIGDGKDAGLKCWIVDFVCGTNIFGGKTETDIAERWGQRKANVNRMVKDMQWQLGIAKMAGGRKADASRTYAIRARRNHAEGKIRKTSREIQILSVWVTQSQTALTT